ncbi:hypothetical protein B0H14DRAFT_3599218 [Mycena olivaceomarginata]|nr:hypothetical protein B0H14DRAFT_3599218 [Mycena olivaceomarginata]
MRVEGFVGGFSEGFWFLRLLDLVVQVTGEVTVQWLPRENDFRPIATQASTKSKLKGCNELELTLSLERNGRSNTQYSVLDLTLFPVPMIDALAADRARIQDLERSLSVLRNQRAVAQERLDSYKYPVLTLPNEIVCEIFIHFLPVYPSCPPLAGSRSPILLTHICAGWRKFALAFPALWRAMEILPRNNPDCLASTLGQSGFCPLSINVDGYGGWDDVGLVLDAILPHRARWEYFSLRLIGDPDSDYPNIGGPMPLLQHLNLEFESDMDEHYSTLGAIDFADFENNVSIQIFFVHALCGLEIPERFLGRDPIDSLASFIAKSGCKLQRVGIVNRSAVSKHSYRTAFPAIRMFFDGGEDSDSDASS